MKQVLLDTDILSAYLKGNKKVVANVRKYLYQFDTLNISIITKYEILSGLYHKDSQNKLKSFLQLLAFTKVLPLDDHAIEIASLAYAQTRSIGEVVDDMDLLIASIALANNMQIATNNHKHFNKIPQLDIVNWQNG